MTLQNAPHENIVEFLGTMNWNGNQLGVLICRGRYRLTIRQEECWGEQRALGELHSSPRCVCYTMFQVLDIANGLQHMHSLKVVHGDLKAVSNAVEYVQSRDKLVILG